MIQRMKCDCSTHSYRLQLTTLNFSFRIQIENFVLNANDEILLQLKKSVCRIGFQMKKMQNWH